MFHKGNTKVAFFLKMHCGANMCVLWTGLTWSVDGLTMHCGMVFERESKRRLSLLNTQLLQNNSQNLNFAQDFNEILCPSLVCRGIACLCPNRCKGRRQATPLQKTKNYFFSQFCHDSAN